MTTPVPLTDDEIARRLAGLPGWARDGNAIARTYAHTWHECVHLLTYVAAKARELGHHPDVDLRWQRIRFSVTTHDAGNRLTEADFELARAIDQIADAHGAAPAED
ncbi:MAG: 4a-hydroxytetrahydrobiopterin dehydratase [Streptosporangiales bacterium]|nr:4a-hydroxytetrahydrobiopterin dehydratase [Streptosporangiales bacterium]